MKKIGRNELCLCGSGKKYKNCCINKLSKEEVFFMYKKQLELTKHLKEKEKCIEILNIGKTIVDNDMNYEWTTGAYVNMSTAKLVLYFKEHSLEDLNMAKKFCQKALILKPTNQMALKELFEISIQSKDFDEALLALRRFEIKEISNPLTIQILESYQRTISYANKINDNEKYKEFLEKATNILFEKYGKNAGLCAIATEYYISVGNDIVKAYENAKRSVEEYPNANMYNTLGLICSNEQLKRMEEAKKYFVKALELADDYEMIKRIKSNYIIPLIESDELNKAEKIAIELIKESPSNQNFSNYAEILKRKGDLEKAEKWAKKALFIIEDDTTLLILADVYKRAKRYEEAIDVYKKCIEVIDDNGIAYNFEDFHGTNMYSIASNKDLKSILGEVFKGIISSYNKQGDYKNAKAFLKLAKEQVPESSDWDVWEETLPEIENANEEYIKAKKLLEESLVQNNIQRNSFREWALKLIQLQDNSKELDLDVEDDWDKYKEKMECILNDMIRIIDKESEVYENSKTMISLRYNYLNNDAKKFLISAEVLYEVHKNSIIDFAPIVVEYCKVIEKQLRVVLANKLTSKHKMLGSIINKIENNRIMPYFNYLDDLKKVNGLRRESAHTGVLGKEDVDKIRDIFYVNKLLEKLVIK